MSNKVKNIALTIFIIVGFIFIGILLYNKSVDNKKETALKKQLVIDNKKKVEMLSSKFYFEKDEFSESNKQIIGHQYNPHYSNANCVYLDIITFDKYESTLFFNIEYVSESFLFINRYVFNIDGEIYKYSPSHIDIKNYSQSIVEWSRSIVDYNNESIVRAIAKAKSVKIKLIGSNSYETRILSDREIQGITESLEYHDALTAIFLNQKY